MGTTHNYKYIKVPASPVSATLMGTYSANSTVDVSSYGSPSLSNFLAVCPTDIQGSGNSRQSSSSACYGVAKYHAPILSISSNTLSITVARLEVWMNYASSTTTRKFHNIETKIYLLS